MQGEHLEGSLTFIQESKKKAAENLIKMKELEAQCEQDVVNGIRDKIVLRPNKATIITRYPKIKRKSRS